MMPVTLPALRSPVSTFALHVREGAELRSFREGRSEPAEMNFSTSLGKSEEMPCLEPFLPNKIFPIYNLPKSKMDVLLSGFQPGKVLNLAVPQDFSCRQ